jgi:hypothetical protein
MSRDIDHIISEIRSQVPDAILQRTQFSGTTESERTWRFSIPDDVYFIALESRDGSCPFIVEHTDTPRPVVQTHSAPEPSDAIALVCGYLENRKRQLGRS